MGERGMKQIRGRMMMWILLACYESKSLNSQYDNSKASTYHSKDALSDSLLKVNPSSPAQTSTGQLFTKNTWSSPSDSAMLMSSRFLDDIHNLGFGSRSFEGRKDGRGYGTSMEGT